MKKGDILKLTACLIMLIDHIGYFFMSIMPAGVYWLLRCIGRFAFPMFAYSLTEGFEYTKNEAKYMLRLFCFAIVSEIPHNLLFKTVLYPRSQNVIFTLLLGLVCLYALKHIKNKYLSVSVCAAIMAAAHFLCLEYGAAGILLILIIYLTKNKPALMCALSFLCLCLRGNEGLASMLYCALGAFGILFARLFSGQARFKYVYYVFYPLHLIILYFLWRVLC